MKKSIKLHIIAMSVMASAMWMSIIGGAELLSKWEIFETKVESHVISEEHTISYGGEVYEKYILYYNEDGSLRDKVQIIP